MLGFELGYSLESPQALVIWEAQFGDFFNGAQIIVDQFLSSGEDKWLRQSGLVLLLPHGYEGQGPEHSSARLERWLQMCNDNPNVLPPETKTKQIQESNWQIVNCTTTANYFHVLRRQIHRDFRKPLIVMSPKSLLRYGPAFSPLTDLSAGTRFQHVIGEISKDLVADDKIKRLILCSGKVFYDLFNYRNEKKIKDVAIIRVEQISPFPYHLVAKEAHRYSKADILWCQEEPMNMGAYTYVAPRIETAIGANRKDSRPKYAGRPPSASPSAGFDSLHKKELADFLKEAFSVPN